MGKSTLLFIHMRAMTDALRTDVREYVTANPTTKETWECLIPGKPRSMNSSTLVRSVPLSVDVYLQRQESFCESLHTCAGPSDAASSETKPSSLKK